MDLNGTRICDDTFKSIGEKVDYFVSSDVATGQPCGKKSHHISQQKVVNQRLKCKTKKITTNHKTIKKNLERILYISQSGEGLSK